MNLLPPPGPERLRQLAGLGALAVVLGGLVWYQFRPTATVVRTSNTAARAAAAIDPVALPQPLKLATLEAVSEASDVGRNPFSFGTRPAPPPPPMPAPMATLPLPPPPPPVPQGPPPIGIRLTGMLVDPRSGRTMVTLRDPATGTLFQAFEGDIVDGRYRVVAIGVESVVVSYVDGTGTRKISLGG
jgi:hypothetical protein